MAKYRYRIKIVHLNKKKWQLFNKNQLAKYNFFFKQNLSTKGRISLGKQRKTH